MRGKHVSIHVSVAAVVELGVELGAHGPEDSRVQKRPGLEMFHPVSAAAVGAKITLQILDERIQSTRPQRFQRLFYSAAACVFNHQLIRPQERRAP